MINSNPFLLSRGWKGLLILALLLSGCRDHENVEPQRPQRTSLKFSSQPILPVAQFTKSSDALGPVEKAVKRFEVDLKKLAEFANMVRAGDKWPEIPAIFANQFETAFIERNELQSVFLGDRIRVARWEFDSQTPSYYETIAVRRLFRTVLEPWRGASEFRIEFRIQELTNRPNHFDARVLVDIFGIVDSNATGASGADRQIGRSAAGVWDFSWEKFNEQNQPGIRRIRMLSHEETINYIDRGLMFQDATASVLRDDESLRNELAYSLDQWAQVIPGIDIAGEHGLAIGDINDDGLDDIYVCQPHGLANLLLIQNPDGTATNQAEKYGVGILDESSSALIVDIDNDRRQDLVVATDSRLVLFSNTGDEAMQREHALKVGFGTRSISSADYDQDGDLDLFLVKFRPVASFGDIFPQPRPDLTAAQNGGRNVLLRNDEAWEFTDVTSEVGMAIGNQRYSRSSAWLDFDVDGDQDLFVASCFGPDSLYENRSGWFQEFNQSAMAKLVSNSTTASVGDVDGNGRLELFVGTDASLSVLRTTAEYESNGGRNLETARRFSRVNRLLSLEKDSRKLDFVDLVSPLLLTESSQSSVIADFNNDSRPDLAVANGWLSRNASRKVDPSYYSLIFDPEKEVDKLVDSFQFQHEISDRCRAGASFNGFQRNGLLLSSATGEFVNYSSCSGFDFAEDARAVATTDWDGDGDLDLVVVNRTAPRLRILLNRYRGVNHFLKIQLVGTRSNRDAIGSRVEVFLAGRDQPLMQSVSSCSGAAAQSTRKLHFGLGDSDSIERVVVYWPDGQSSSYSGFEPDNSYQLVEGIDEPAESGDDRYRIALEDRPLNAELNLPKRTRIDFFPTARLPILQFRSFGDPQKQKWYQVENMGERPLLCLILDRDENNAELLGQFNSIIDELDVLDSDLVAVFHGNMVDNDAHVKQSLKQIESVDFQAVWGVLSKSSNRKLAQLRGQWFFDQRMPREPLALLLDADGNVHHAWRGQHVRWENIQPMLTRIAQKKFRLNEPNGEGNWIQYRRIPQVDWLQVRFGEMGYERDAREFSELGIPAYARDYLYRAIDLAHAGKLNDAIAAAEKSRELNPDSVETLIELAEIYRKFSLNSDAQTRKRTLRTAGELLDQALSREPDNVDAILARAEIYRLQVEIESALALLINYLKSDPDSWEVHAYVGRLFFHKRDYVEAARYLIAAFDGRPTLPWVAGDLGILYLKRDQYGDAADFLRLATRLQPSEQRLQLYLAEAEFWKGNFQAAGDLFEATASIQPVRSHSRKMLALLRASSPFGSFRDGEAGLELMEPFIDSEAADSPSILEVQAACLAETGEWESAVKVQKRALQLIENDRTVEKYSRRQIAALKNRLNAYGRKKPYRLKDINDVPLNPLGRK